MREHFDYVVIGGGIAGVSCVQQLQIEDVGSKCLLLSASNLVKAVTNFKQISRAMEEFEVEEKSADFLEGVQVVMDMAATLNPAANTVTTKSGKIFSYDKVCVCAGANPKKIAGDEEYVLGIRDTESVQVLQKKLENARRVVVVGNGGIATELVYELRGCQVIWLIKDDSISSTFFDAGAAQFFLPSLSQERVKKEAIAKRTKYTAGVRQAKDTCAGGSALGPDWSLNFSLSAAPPDKSFSGEKLSVSVVYSCQVVKVCHSAERLRRKGLHEVRHAEGDDGTSGDWPVTVEVTGGQTFGCDVVVSATGVEPNTKWLRAESDDKIIQLAEDGGIVIDSEMRTSWKNVYAAGDVCNMDNWMAGSNGQWFQMRLWGQARQAGCYAARCMATHRKDGDEVVVQRDFCFEMFAHVTRFFGKKVVLLGRYNAQGIPKENYHVLLRVNPGVEFVKCVMQDGHMVGAILIGETDLEETFENLILNRVDLTDLEENLLDPNIDIEDYFD